VEFQTETCQKGTPAEVIDSRGSLKVVEHLEGETVQRRAQRGEEELLRIL
jgi:hypothetical protein